ncbi:hypothetical protein N0V86_007523 [Didymella sp. IMI 355093]|nr:hypothetical protein N0V86_007523 [Didymella sp. IMI 355093]
MPSNINSATEERSQPWQKVQEVQNLMKPEMPAANAEAGADASTKTDEEPLKLNLFRIALNASTTNIADVKDH